MLGYSKQAKSIAFSALKYASPVWSPYIKQNVRNIILLESLFCYGAHCTCIRLLAWLIITTNGLYLLQVVVKTPLGYLLNLSFITSKALFKKPLIYHLVISWSPWRFTFHSCIVFLYICFYVPLCFWCLILVLQCNIIFGATVFCPIASYFKWLHS